MVIERAKNTEQGKGLVFVLEDLASASPRALRPKSGEEAIRDYCWSALVLSAAFSFRVVPGQTYFLYLHAGLWKLSLISPREWGQKQPGDFVAHCALREDMTWSIEFDAALEDASVAQDALHRYLEGIRSQLASAGSWRELLRHGERHLPYQQRVLATALATSLRHSLLLSGHAGAPPAVAVHHLERGNAGDRAVL